MRLFIYLSASVLLFGFKGFAQEDTFCENFVSVNKLIQKYHYSAKPVNDSLSAYVFRSFLEKLDEDEVFLRTEDYNVLKKHEVAIDDYLKVSDCSFMDDFYTLYKNRLTEIKKLLENLDVNNLDFSEKDSLYYLNLNKFSFAGTKEEQYKFWDKRIKKQAIYKFLDLEDSTLLFEEKKADFAAQALANELCTITDKLSGDDSLRKKMQDWFLDIFCSYFDPHTNYFNNSDKSYFDESLHDDYKSIGLFFSKSDEGIISVSEVRPGSTAWKNSSVEVGDQVLRISSNENVLDMDCISLERLYTFIYNPSYQTILLRIKRKASNEISEVTLNKENLHVTENTVSSYILNGNSKIGYINLPGFYTSEEFGMGCASDLAKELIRLNQENVEALILDLRDNGGGSLKEATDLVGLFIDRGPVAIINTNENDKEVAKDYNRGTVFNKPLIVLVNGNSASASEYVTAALQDHGRALVAGTPTFGKASGQSVFSVDRTNPEAGFVKITIEKLYRITGRSWQKFGVIPDFPFPDALEGFDYREEEFDNVLDNDTIVKNVYFKIPEKKSITNLQKKSEERLNKLNETASIRNINEELHTYFKDKKPLPLNLESIKHRKDSFDAIWSKLDVIKVNHSSFKVENTPIAKEILAGNNDEAMIDNEKKENLLKDYQLQESYLILTDLLKKR